MTDKRTEGELSPENWALQTLDATLTALEADMPRAPVATIRGLVRTLLEATRPPASVAERTGGKLRPCPFCGGRDLDYDSRNCIECRDCGGSMMRDLNLDMAPDESDALMRTAWNTRQEARTTPAGLDEAIALIREAKTTLAPFAVRSAKKPTSSAANSAIWKLEAAVGFLSKPSPPAPAGLDREGVARIIEPSAWRLPTFDRLEDRKVALAKADAILAMVRP